MEEEVSYASVVFKTPKVSPTKAKKEEETVYDEVKSQSKTTDQAADTPDRKPANGCHRAQLLAWCLGILCVILVLAIIALAVYLATAKHEGNEKLESELKYLKDNQTALLAVNQNLSSANDNLRRDHTNLTARVKDLRKDFDVLEGKNNNLTSENLQLKTEKITLVEKIENVTRETSELNLTRAQWTFDNYCYIKEGEAAKDCHPCQKGWLLFGSSCYVYFDFTDPSDFKTWEEARENCRGRNADLVVVEGEEEQEYIRGLSNGDTEEANGYWIGLRDAAGTGTWNWVDGRTLNKDYWVNQNQPSLVRPASPQCAISLRGPSPKGWSAVDCTSTKRWMCEIKALSV